MEKRENWHLDHDPSQGSAPVISAAISMRTALEMSDSDDLDLLGDFAVHERVRKAAHEDAPSAGGERPAVRRLGDLVDLGADGEDEAESDTWRALVVSGRCAAPLASRADAGGVEGPRRR